MTSTAGRMISVETALQADRLPQKPDPADRSSAGVAPWPMVRQQHRVAAGTTIRALLVQAGLQRVVASIESGAVGLALHGRRAWLDDVLRDGSRVEVLEPINADAKAARAERVAADRGRRKARFGATR